MRTFKILIVVACVFIGAIASACGGASPDAAANALKPFTADVEKLLAETRGVLTPLAQDDARGDGVVACNALMAEKGKAYPQYTALGVAALDGTLFCLSTPQSTPANILDRTYFQRALQTKDFAIGDYQIARVTRKKAFGIGYPILDASNTPQGIVLAPVDLDWLNQRLAAISLPSGAELVMLDSQGTVVAHLPSQMDLVGTAIGDTPLGKAMLSQTDGSGEFAGVDGVTRLYKFTSPNGSNKNLIMAVGLKK